MKLKKLCIYLIILLFSEACNLKNKPEILRYEDIVERLYNFEYLAEFPEKGEKSGNFSSYNRESKYNENTDVYEAWHANADGNGYIREEGTDIIAAEIKGPGVIWRVWSAAPREGHIKFYIDNEIAPVLDIPFKEYFNSSSELFNYPALVHILAKGYNNYVPIAFQESCKIVFSEGWGRFYQFTYSTFNEGTIIPSFRGSFSAEEKAALHLADNILSDVGENALNYKKSDKIEKNITIAPGETLEVYQIKGAKAITSMQFKLNQEEEDDPIYILRELALSIFWDNEVNPSVWSPLGDFFGSAPGINNYKSLPMGMTDEGFYSNWYMPFSKNAIIRLSNDGKQKRNLTFQISYVHLKKSANKYLRFHAKWHRDAYPGLDKQRYIKGDRWPDWPFLVTNGTGRFCGICLNVWNPNPRGVIRKNIPTEELTNVPDKMVPIIDSICRRYWWGEGDEKFFVDGEKFPSTFGTGTEDYFGYAWCTPEYFVSAFQNQTLNVGNRGHISVNRFQIADNVPFMSSFEACLEKYHPNEWPLLYSCVAYWYQDAESSDPYGPVSATDRVHYYVQPEIDQQP